ncbi:photosystem I assembly protein Ycf4 [Geitlerinema sp. P-1104]|uniref:photosystem I assembly protein Ycf4 n=1 Tax=Geitlerinema sp. P-1104 TaxID=2546230 RepID=UPI0014769814|nr:photosystem I assembly protein Ycf4 [Geitlerinema sp. P-1104]NMG59299.1 photosystem I assembly protein Ycf4 [Geitlerinema sp. P-1104]
MTAQTVTKSDRTLTQPVLGSRRFSNYFWATVVLVGGVGFLLAGISSYTQVNLLPFANPTELIFVPQGLVMGLYGSAAILLSTYLWFVIIWDVGGGYNEFNLESGKVTVFRWGFPGKNRRIEITCDVDAIKSIRVDIKDGVNPKRALYLRAKGMRDIPLTRVGQPLSLAEVENRAAELARFLSVPLEGL